MTASFGTGEEDIPEDWRSWSPEAKRAFLQKIRGRYISLGLGGPRKWRQSARPKQLPPDDPMHHLPDENGFACGCDGPDEDWNIWMFMAGRGCVAGHTRVYLPLEDRHERIDVLARQGKPITVLSLTGQGAVPARTEGAPFIRGMAPLHRVTLDDGTSITVTEHHRFLTPQGWRQFAGMHVGQLLAGNAHVPHETYSTFRSESPAYVPRSKRTGEGSLDGYQTCRSYDDQLLHQALAAVRASVPSPADADERNRSSSLRGGQTFSRGYSRHDPRCTHHEDVCEPWGGEQEARISSALHTRCSHYSQALQLSPDSSFPVLGTHVALARQKSTSGEHHYVSSWHDRCTDTGGESLHRQRSAVYESLDPESLSQLTIPAGSTPPDSAGSGAARFRSGHSACDHVTAWKQVTAIQDAGFGVFYDLTVPRAENYAAEGMWNHNCGKTWAGSNWIIEQALKNPGTMWAVVAPTFRDVRVTCFEGPSGIRRQLEPGEEEQWRRNELRLDLVNGSVIYGYSADQPERLRGSNLSGAWCDETGSWQYEETWYEGLVPALRIGEHPRVLVTSTPRPTHLMRDLFSRRDGTLHRTTASTWENAKNLSAAALDELRRRYEGTRLGRQELEGELLEDLEGALWKRSDIDAARVRLGDVPDLVRVVVGIDPAVTSTEESDETGIIVAGDDGHGHGYVLADYSMKGTPEMCMREAVRAYKRHGADCIVAEVNNGGDFIGAVLRAVDPDVPYHTVRASRGKALRAEPVSALAEQRRLHHVGSFPELEDQLCSYVPGIGTSPDRMDALIWSCFELRGLSQSSWLSAYGVTRCTACENAYSSGLKECPRCRAANPLEAERIAAAAEPAADPEPSPGSWASVYKLKRCAQGHTYSDRGAGCPRCHSGGLAFLQKNGRNVDTRGMSG